MRQKVQEILDKYGVSTIAEAIDRQMWDCIDEIAGIV